MEAEAALGHLADGFFLGPTLDDDAVDRDIVPVRSAPCWQWTRTGVRLGSVAIRKKRSTSRLNPPRPDGNLL